MAKVGFPFNRLFLSLFSLLLGWVLAGCAAQTSSRAQITAEQKLIEAQKVDPNSKHIKEASDKISEGKSYLSDGFYDQAMKSFKESVAASNLLLVKPKAEAKPEAKPEVKPEVKAEVAAAQQAEAPKVEEQKPEVKEPTEASVKVESEMKSEVKAEPTVESAKPAEAPAVAVAPAPTPAPSAAVKVQEKPVSNSTSKKDKKGLPGKALAKYLAAKKATTPPPVAKTEAAAKKPAETKLTEPAPKAVAKVEAKEKVEVQEDPKEKALQEKEKKSIEDLAKKIQEEGAVLAPAKPALKKIPVQSADDGKKSPVADEEKNELTPRKIEALKPEPAKPGELLKRKIPGGIPFAPNDPSVQSEAIANLDQTSKFLLDNPSTTLVLQGHLSTGESATLVDARFESIRSYLTGKGVPEDQIRLDSDRKTGKTSEFQMFLIEH